MDKDNKTKWSLLKGDSYPEKAGMLIADATMLRRSLKAIYDAIEIMGLSDQIGWPMVGAKIDLDLTAYLTDHYNDTPQDRRLSNGDIKDGNTGRVYEAPITPQTRYGQ